MDEKSQIQALDRSPPLLPLRPGLPLHAHKRLVDQSGRTLVRGNHAQANSSRDLSEHARAARWRSRNASRSTSRIPSPSFGRNRPIASLSRSKPLHTDFWRRTLVQQSLGKSSPSAAEVRNIVGIALDALGERTVPGPDDGIGSTVESCLAALARAGSPQQSFGRRTGAGDGRWEWTIQERPERAL